LGGLPRAPSRDNPVNNPLASKQRQRYVLGRMLATERISKEQYEAALVEPVKIVITPTGMTTQVPYLAEHIRRDLLERFGEEKVYEGGLSVHTTVSLKNQLAAQKAVDAGLRSVDKRMGLRRPLKRLISENEIADYLTKQHRTITQDFYNYRLLLPDEKTLRDAISDTEATPLQVGRNYEAVISGKNAKDRSIQIRVGNRTGKILPDNYSWALRANPDEIYSEKVIRNPYTEYKNGDLITVQVKDPAAPALEFVLEQNPVVQGAIIAYNAKTGGLEAVVGGYDFEVTKSQFNRAIQAVRQPGSTFKPFVYAAAIEAGLTPSTIIVDSPIVYRDAGEQEGLEKVWKPGNYSEKFYGDTTLRNALAFSRNVPTIKLAQHLKISTVIDFAKKMGITSPLQADLSLALGSSAVGLNEMVLAWTPFVNHGRKLRNFFLTKVEDRSGELLFEDIAAQSFLTTPENPGEVPAETPVAAPTAPAVDETLATNDPSQVITPEVSYIVTSLLRSVVDYGTATSVQSLGRPVAAKTGTTNDFKDAWFVGYTTDIISGVWIGFDEDRPIGRNETGGVAAAPIWLDFMTAINEKSEKKEEQEFTVPKNVIRVTVDAKTGDLPTARTEKTLQEVFIDGNAPGQTPTEETAAVATKGTNVSSLDKKIRTQVITGNPNFVGNGEEDPSSRDEGLDEMIREDL
jgi:penicillin-binding protein 1A